MRYILPRLAATALAWSLLATSALAQPEDAAQSSAVVLAFSGPEGNTARTAVVRALEGEIQLASVRDALTVAGEIGADIATLEGRAAVGRQLGVDLVVHGQVLRVGDEVRTEIVVESSDGRDLARVEAMGPLTRAGRQDVGARAVEAVRQAMATLEAERAAGAAAAPTPEEVSEGAAEEPAESEAAAGAVVRSPTHIVSVYGGLGMRHRNAELRLEGGGTRTYDVNFATFSVHGDFFPLGDSDSLGARGFHVAFDFATGLGLKTTLPGVGQTERTPYYDFDVSGGYLYPFEHGKAGFSAGYGLERYNIPTGGGFPSTTYHMLRFALGGSYDVFRDVLAVTAEYGVLVPLSVGQLTDYGDHSVAVGVDLIVGVQGGFDFGLTYAFRFGWERYDLRMAGDPLDGYPMATSGSDSGVWIDLQAGYRWR